MSGDFDKELSKTLSHALRHEPWLYDLELDDEGWVPVEAVLVALRQERPEWADLSEADLQRMIANSAKRRHEVEGGQIRALYGHSLPDKLQKRVAVPPEVLFHGTSPGVIPLVLASGLLPMSRQYVHLSTVTEMAREVGRRKANPPTILRIMAADAHAQGVCFYVGNDRVWLADHIPAKYIMIEG